MNGPEYLYYKANKPFKWTIDDTESHPSYPCVSMNPITQETL